MDALSGAPLPYSEFKRLLYAGQVAEVTISRATVNGPIRAGSTWHAR